MIIVRVLDCWSCVLTVYCLCLTIAMFLNVLLLHFHNAYKILILYLTWPEHLPLDSYMHSNEISINYGNNYSNFKIYNEKAETPFNIKHIRQDTNWILKWNCTFINIFFFFYISICKVFGFYLSVLESIFSFKK